MFHAIYGVKHVCATLMRKASFEVAICDLKGSFNSVFFDVKSFEVTICDLKEMFEVPIWNFKGSFDIAICDLKKSRRDGILLTGGFNPRKRHPLVASPAGTTLFSCIENG